MIKTEIPTPNHLVDHVDKISADLENMFGPSVPRAGNNRRERKQWSVSADYYHRKIVVMCRYPEQAVLVRLKWL